MKWQSRGKSLNSMPVYHANEEDLDWTLIGQILNWEKDKQIPKESSGLSDSAFRKGYVYSRSLKLAWRHSSKAEFPLPVLRPTYMQDVQ